HPAEQDLAAIAALQRLDGFLLELQELADADLATAVGLLVNGMIVIGVLASPMVVAVELDRERERLAKLSDLPESMSVEEWGKARLQVLRVPIRQIAGWWPIRIDESGSASFTLFEADPE